MPRVEADLTRFIDVMQYFRIPTPMGAGASAQRGLGELFDAHVRAMAKRMEARGFCIIPTAAWTSIIDRSGCDSHCKKNGHNWTPTFFRHTHAATYANMAGVIKSLASQPRPFRAPAITPITDEIGHAVASELSAAMRGRLEQTQ